MKRVSSRKANGIQQHAIIKSLRHSNSFIEALPANKTLTRRSTKIERMQRDEARVLDV